MASSLVNVLVGVVEGQLGYVRVGSDPKPIESGGSVEDGRARSSAFGPGADDAHQNSIYNERPSTVTL